MDEQSHLQNDPPVQSAEDQKAQSPRRAYEKPHIETHDVSKSILGNESPVTSDGLSGSFRV